MGRYRSKSRSYSPRRSRSQSPPRRNRYDEPRDRYRSSRSHRDRDRRSSGPTGLLVRNISLDARAEDLRIPFERFGRVKDVYLPKNYYTGEPRGFGFVKFQYAEDAAEAKERLNHEVIGGREISIAFAEENRKTPQEMRMSARISDRYRRRSPPQSPRRRHHSYSRSPSPIRRSSRGSGRSSRYDYYSPEKSISRSPTPRNGRSISRTPPRCRSISKSLTPRGRSISRSPSPRGQKSFSMSVSPRGQKSISRSVSSRGRKTVSPRGRRSISRPVSPRGRKSVSRSVSPHGRRPVSRSLARRISVSRPPSHDRKYRSDSRSPSPRGNSRSPSRSRSYSPRR